MTTVSGKRTQQVAFDTFWTKLTRDVSALPASSSEDDRARIFLDQLNRFFYQESPSAGREYVSAFHQWWQQHHAAVLGPRIDRDQARKAAKALEAVFATPSMFPHLEVRSSPRRAGLPDRAVANVRFFTAIQDFKINISKEGQNAFLLCLKTPQWFTARDILAHPEVVDLLLAFLGVTGSQGDKRRTWMLAAAQFLVETSNGDAYELFGVFKGDALAIRTALSSNGGIGYSEKKADMFLRDMADWGVWSYQKNFDRVNVASDANTMRIVLRTGVLATRLPLLASYLDVYGYEYSLVDEWTQAAWRAVWEEWGQIPGNHRPATPASIDHLLYASIGRKLCKPKTPKCTACIFDPVCPAQNRVLRHPRSISRLGQTGWESGRTNNGGGGGIMS